MVDDCPRRCTTTSWPPRRETCAPAAGVSRPFIAWGWGVEKDPAQALAFFRLSAPRNFLTAYTYIGDALLAMETPDLPEAMANYIIAREAGLLKDTKKSREEAEEARAKLDEVKARMTTAQIEEGQRIADTWIAQYGLLDFNLVHQ